MVISFSTYEVFLSDVDRQKEGVSIDAKAVVLIDAEVVVLIDAEVLASSTCGT
ncbi:hypothetical protein DY000_02040042 [Brassica cretica]|uniref:Uncharacterized protein n=1 Tax=Brassica cretica TaxID=69181 RepID=A0ABQ7BPL7_BRACR|nr:hypothetical protein DY000_02040042 [Brassica cretica]